MPARCNRGFIADLIVWKHVSGSNMPIIRSSRVLYSGYSAPYQTSNLKTTARNTTGSKNCIILLSSWWWACWCPKHVEQAIRSAKKTSVHLVGIYFYIFNDDARSKSHQITPNVCVGKFYGLQRRKTLN